MKRGHILGDWAAAALVPSVLGFCLIADGPITRLDSTFGSVLRGLAWAFREPASQWIVVTCSAVYFLTFNLLRQLRSGSPFWRMASPALWLTATLAVTTLAYLLDHQLGARTTQALVMIGGATIGQGAALLTELRESSANRKKINVVNALLALLIAGALIKGNEVWGFQYRGERRRQGIWDNPNMFGVLMAAGVVLAVGRLTSSLRFPLSHVPHNRKGRNLKALSKVGFCSIAAITTSIALVGSYSRGAWVGVLVGLAYLAWHPPTAFTAPDTMAIPSPHTPPVEPKHLYGSDRNCNAPQLVPYRRHLTPFAIVLASLLVLAFWNLRHTQATPVRRVFSVLNVNDFSRRNRLAAWEAAFQMMAERPLLGVGWNMQDQIYDHFFRSSRLSEFRAIRANDFFTLGTTLGVPVLVCFAVYIGLSLSPSSNLENRNFSVKNRNPEPTSQAPADCLCPPLPGIHLSPAAICRSGAAVFLVCFWFDGIDGGLFRLATGPLFWTLLELGKETWSSRRLEAQPCLDQ